MKFWNVTLHVSLPAETAEEAERLALELLEDRHSGVNVNVFEGDTVLCSGWDTENENCLAGVRCPLCKQNDSFYIEGTDDTGTRTLEMTDDGCDAVGDFEYDHTAACRCTQCEWSGTVDEATSEEK